MQTIVAARRTTRAAFARTARHVRVTASKRRGSVRAANVRAAAVVEQTKRQNELTKHGIDWQVVLHAWQPKPHHALLAQPNAAEFSGGKRDPVTASPKSSYPQRKRQQERERNASRSSVHTNNTTLPLARSIEPRNVLDAVQLGNVEQRGAAADR
jgi:hypothetical protein